MRYFSVSGVQCKLLDFDEDCDDTAKDIHQILKTYLEKHELDISCIKATAEDNANVTLGNTIRFPSY